MNREKLSLVGWQLSCHIEMILQSLNFLELIYRVPGPSRAAVTTALKFLSYDLDLFLLFSTRPLPECSLVLLDEDLRSKLWGQTCHSVPLPCPSDGRILCQDLIFADLGTFWHPACMGPRQTPTVASWMNVTRENLSSQQVTSFLRLQPPGWVSWG